MLRIKVGRVQIMGMGNRILLEARTKYPLTATQKYFNGSESVITAATTNRYTVTLRLKKYPFTVPI